VHHWQAQINSLIRAELERRSTTAAAALPPEGVAGSVASVDAASGSQTPSTPPDLATAGLEWEPAYGIAGVIGRGRVRGKHRVWHKRDCKIIEGVVCVAAGCLSTDLLTRLIPSTYRQAKLSLDSAHWQKAMEVEQLGIANKNVFTRVERRQVPRGAKILSTKWVYDLKKNEHGLVVRNKARLTVRGFEARTGLEHTNIFASVLRMSSLRLVLSLAVGLGLRVHMVDIVQAFLCANLI
jgi:hypothetical protein